MDFHEKDMGEIEEILPGILSRCGLESFVDVGTLKMWMTELDEKGDMSYITMITGLLDDITELDKEIVDNLLGALIRLHQLTPSGDDGRTLDEEMERRRDDNEPTFLHLSEMNIPPMEWCDDYEDAMGLMRQQKFSEASEKFEDTFDRLLGTRTTWRDIYRLYCNAGLTYLYSGNMLLGTQCLVIACEMNPSYEFAHERLRAYQDGEMQPYIQMGFLARMRDNYEQWQDRPEHLDLDRVMGWPESRILKKLVQYGVKIDRDRFSALASTLHSPDDLAREYLDPQADVSGEDEDFIWIAAYALWNIYCPNEPSTSAFNKVLEKAAELTTKSLKGSIGPSGGVKAKCSKYLDRIRRNVLSDKEGFLEYWSETYEYAHYSRNNLKYFMRSIVSSPTFEEKVMEVVGRLKDRIAHPDWNAIEMEYLIRKGDPKWKTIYEELRTRHPFHCYVGSDVSMVFEDIGDDANIEKYLLSALETVDARAENEIYELETTRTTIYGDYKYILDRLSGFYERSGADDSKSASVKAKMELVEERAEAFSASPAEEEVDENMMMALYKMEAERANESPATRYYHYLQKFGINFETDEDVPTYRNAIKIGPEDYKRSRRLGSRVDEETERIKKKAKKVKRKKKKRKTGRNEPCPCGSGKKYKKCCLKIV